MKLPPLHGEGVFYKGGIIMKLSRDVLSKSIISYAEVKVKAPIIITDPFPYVKNWTNPRITNDVLRTSAQDLCYSPALKKFCLLTSSSAIYPDRYPCVLTSSDGINWVEQTDFHKDRNFRFNVMIWCPDLKIFCALGSNERDDRGVIAISSDGVSWEYHFNALFGTLSVNALTWSPELHLFCAAIYGDGVGTDFVLISSDGINWTKQSIPLLPGGYGDYNDIYWCSDLSIFVLVDAGGVFTSPDGKTWTPHVISYNGEAAYLTTVDWSPDLQLFCTVEWQSNNVWVSLDGVNWTRKIFPKADEKVKYIRWSPTLKIFLTSSEDAYQGFYATKDTDTWVRIEFLGNDPSTYTVPRGRSISLFWCDDLGVYVNLAWQVNADIFCCSMSTPAI